MRFPYQANLVSLIVIVGAATLMVTQLNGSIVPNLATGATVTTSSKEPNTPDPSKFIDGDIFRMGFHTTKESRPWVRVDLGRDKQIHRLVVYNRVDCCHDRAIPIVVKLGLTDEDCKEVGRIESGFEIWEREFTPRAARVIRIESESTDYFSLSELEVR